MSHENSNRHQVLQFVLYKSKFEFSCSAVCNPVSERQHHTEFLCPPKWVSLSGCENIRCCTVWESSRAALSPKISPVTKELGVLYQQCPSACRCCLCSVCDYGHFTGLSDIPGEAMVKLYCPKCMDVYTPKSSRHHHTDGAYFGTGFPHMLFMVHPEYRPKRPANQFVPRLVHQAVLEGVRRLPVL